MSDEELQAASAASCAFEGPAESERNAMAEGAPDRNDAVQEALPATTTDVGPLQDVMPDETTARPANVPEKFWDAKAGAVRMESLLKSYLELEKKLGGMVSLPDEDDLDGRDRLQRALGKPESAEGYKIEARDGFAAPDPVINQRLYEAGFSNEQAQLVYDLAVEHLAPALEEVNREATQSIEQSKLAAHFGGEQKWQAIAPQIKTWAEANLSEEVFETLGSSYDGVIAIYQMMQTREPSVISETAAPTSDVNPDQLSQMMKDPRYWRDRDPTFVAQVTEGYKRLYG
jgi:hypothetical protein